MSVVPAGMTGFSYRQRGTFGDNPDEPTIYQTTARRTASLRCARTLDGWRLRLPRRVRVPVVGAVAVGNLPRSVIGLLNVEGGGFTCAA